MHQISFGGRAPPGPAGELTRPSSCIKGCLLLKEERGGEGWGEEGWEGEGWEVGEGGRSGEGMGNMHHWL